MIPATTGGWSCHMDRCLVTRASFSMLLLHALLTRRHGPSLCLPLSLPLPLPLSLSLSLSSFSIDRSVNKSTGPPATSTQSHHTSFVELRNGSFAAIGRSHDIDGTMPFALSTDGGHVWRAKKSEFTGIHGGEREVMIRLGSLDQPLMHCTFANGPVSYNITWSGFVLSLFL